MSGVQSGGAAAVVGRAAGGDASPSTPPLPAPPAIRTIGLSKRFGRASAVDGVELRVERGSVYGLIGLNGAGKSTTIRMLMGLLRPTAGRCEIGGVDVARDPVAVRAGVGYVPDRPTAYPWMRVREVVRFCKAVQRRWDDALVEDLLRRGRIDPGKRVKRLSKGMGAKLSLALALGHDPDVLILDEPTDGLDPIARDEFLENVLATVCDRQRTVLMSSHALTDVQKMADVIGLMHEGRLMVQCPTEELVRTTKRIRAVMADAGGAGRGAVPGAVWSRVEGREWVVTVRGGADEAIERVRAAGAERVEVEDMSLDEVFKDFVRGQESAA